MSKASEFIENIEAQTGHRIDENGHDNPAMWAALGAMARMMGQNHHGPRDDVAAGAYIMHASGKEKLPKAFVDIVLGGMDPGDLHDLKKSLDGNND